MIKKTITFNNKTKLVNKVVSHLIFNAVKKGAKVMEREIKLVTPVKEGLLKKAINSRDIKDGESEVYNNVVQDGVDINYAKHVEYGTKYMAPRAMFRKGTKNAEPKIKQLFVEAGKDLYNGNVGVK